MPTQTSKHFKTCLALACVSLLLLITLSHPSIRLQFRIHTDTTFSEQHETETHSPETLASSTPFDAQPPLVRRHVAIVTSVGHSEVFGPLAWTINTVMSRHDQPTSVKIYAAEPPFLSLLKRIGMLPGDIMRNKQHLHEEIISSALYEDDAGAMIDMVVLGTCELDLERFGPDLLEAWDQRPHDQKFTLVCGVHNGHTTGWFKHISEWSSRGAFRVMPISDHVSDYFRSTFDAWADSKDPIKRLSLYEYIKVDPYYPVSDFTNFPLRARPEDQLGNKVPCSAVLQGNYEQGRRDYARVFEDLSRLIRGAVFIEMGVLVEIARLIPFIIKEDAKNWGYQWNSDEH
ncbi:hypothetical protein FRB90_007666, partial [Tulasnella sp. 427]